MTAMSKIQFVSISEVKENPDNPRTITEVNFKKLVKSIKAFPKMLEIRPIVVNAEGVVLGGNMRLKACKEAGLKEIPIISAEGLTEAEQKEFIIKDNVGFGAWDWDALANTWEVEDLEEWGLDIPGFDSETDFSEKNKEIDIDDLEGSMIIKLKYTEDEYHLIREQLSKIAETPEQAVWKLLGNE
jgi:ParB-like chromosome segregation protein Spo0J